MAGLRVRRRRRRMAAFAAVLGLGVWGLVNLVGCLGPHQPSGRLPGDDMQLAFAHNGREISVLAAGGGRARRLTDEGQDPAWSPDGRQIAFSSGVIWKGDADIWVVRADGTEKRNLTETPDFSESEPSWSPDGQKIAFYNYGIAVTGAGGGHRRRLTDEGQAPAWSPDGRQIAFSSSFSSYGDHDYDIVIMKADGTGLRRLFLVRPAHEPSWSPDGRRIAFRGDGSIWVVAADGSGLRRLTHRTENGPFDGEPAWAPDGKWIAFEREFVAPSTYDSSSHHEIWLIRPDGTGLRRLLRGESGAPAWRPRVTRLARVTSGEEDRG